MSDIKNRGHDVPGEENAIYFSARLGIEDVSLISNIRSTTYAMHHVLIHLRQAAVLP